MNNIIDNCWLDMFAGLPASSSSPSFLELLNDTDMPDNSSDSNNCCCVSLSFAPNLAAPWLPCSSDLPYKSMMLGDDLLPSSPLLPCWWPQDNKSSKDNNSSTQQQPQQEQHHSQESSSTVLHQQLHPMPRTAAAWSNCQGDCCCCRTNKVLLTNENANNVWCPTFKLDRQQQPHATSSSHYWACFVVENEDHDHDHDMIMRTDLPSPPAVEGQVQGKIQCVAITGQRLVSFDLLGFLQRKCTTKTPGTFSVKCFGKWQKARLVVYAQQQLHHGTDDQVDEPAIVVYRSCVFSVVTPKTKRYWQQKPLLERQHSNSAAAAAETKQQQQSNGGDGDGDDFHDMQQRERLSPVTQVLMAQKKKRHLPSSSQTLRARRRPRIGGRFVSKEVAEQLQLQQRKQREASLQKHRRTKKNELRMRARTIVV